MTPAEPLLVWSDALEEFIGFVAAFCAAGAIGLRFAVLRGLTGAGSDEADHRLAGRIAQRGAWVGALGAAISAALWAVAVPEFAQRRQMTVPALLLSMPAMQIQATCLVLALVGFVGAARRSDFGWLLAALGVSVAPFRGLVTGDPLRLVNPVHEFAGGLWIGTLAYLVVLAIPGALGETLPRARRGAAVASLVSAFSPLALIAVPVLALCGAITAWRHLHGLHNLWTTPYGWALVVKLALVAVVAGLGWSNWKRHTPRLGSEDAAHGILRSARAETAFAVLVLIATAILVSLPSPEPPGR